MRNSLRLLLALIVAGSAVAVDKADFDAVVDFGTTLADLPAIGAAIERGDPVDGRVVILEGTVSGTVTLVPDSEQFEAYLFLLTGRWDGVQEIETYECYVRVTGPEFADRVPARRPRDPSPDTILVNSRVLVAAIVEGVAMDGTVLLHAYHVRVLE